MDPKKTALLLNIVKFVLSGIGVLACILIINGPNTNAGSQVVEEFRDGFEMSFYILLVSQRKLHYQSWVFWFLLLFM